MKHIKYALILLAISFLLCGCAEQDKYGVKSLIISPTTASIQSGKTQQFTCKAIYNDGTERDFTPSWGVSSQEIGSIASDGLFSAKIVSSTTEGSITASFLNVIAYATIEVMPNTNTPSNDADIPSGETPAVTPETSDFPHQFAISGNKIVDQKGNEVVFRGVNILDPAYMDAVYYNLNDKYFSELASWKATIIRIPMHPAAYKYYGKDNYIKIVNKTLDLAGKHKIYAILDFHSIGFMPDGTFMPLKSTGTPWTGDIYEYTEQEVKDFWKEISAYYKDDNRVVFYEIFNEPTSRAGAAEVDSWAAWKLKSEELIDIIRANDPDSKIIVNGLNYGYDLSYVDSNPVNRENIVYGTHPYPSQTKQPDIAFGALKSKYPVFATEFGYDSTAVGQAWLGNDLYGHYIIAYLESKKISWTVWSFSTEWWPALLTDWSYTPTASGQLFKNYLTSF